MKVLLNRLPNSRNVSLASNNSAINQFSRSHVEGTIYRYTVTMGTEISTYSTVFLNHLIGQTVTVSLWVRSSVDVKQAYLLGGDMTQSLQKGVWKRLQTTLTVGENQRLPSVFARAMQVGDYIDIKEEVMVNAGSQPADVWLPALEDLQQEQRALYPPSGDYTEVMSI